MDRIRNEHVKGTAQLGQFGDKVGEERLRWFGNVQRRDIRVHREKMLGIELPGRRKRGRLRRRYGCCEEGYGGGWCDGEDWEIERYDLLWQPLMGSAERSRRRIHKINFCTCTCMCLNHTS